MVILTASVSGFASVSGRFGGVEHHYRSASCDDADARLRRYQSGNVCSTQPLQQHRDLELLMMYWYPIALYHEAACPRHCWVFLSKRCGLRQLQRVDQHLCSSAGMIFIPVLIKALLSTVYRLILWKQSEILKIFPGGTWNIPEPNIARRYATRCHRMIK